MASNRQKIDQLVRQERLKTARDLILAAVPFTIALGAAFLTFIDPESGSTLVRALTFTDRLLLLAAPVLIAITALLFAMRAFRRIRSPDKT